jgi:sec-independent protein translocase protein TatA
MFGGHWEILLIVLLGVLLFGSAKLPKLFNNMGRSINEFKAGMAEKPEALEEKTDKKEESKETADV